ncbi:hydroxymethylglutaryl-CoA synthase [Ramicandelaber brevisporus]|nr:hydroxymethylglutaryl-CoA synthase [Ramicandelaber brevisporus]
MTRPSNIGIRALDVYFPSRFVDQTELEQFDGVSAGKYTIGLGQLKMAFTDDREDIHSFCLSAVQNFMEKYGVKYEDIGRLEVGTETIVDKSKSTKTVLMQLFQESGNFNVEGIDTTNACYGGTSALFNALQWVDSSYWDGRLALVVAGDIAVYASGPARPSGGAGVAVMLVGPDAPLVVEPQLRGTYMDHLYDFYKPDLSSEFPVVDGPLSTKSYVAALDKAYSAYLAKLAISEPETPSDRSAFDYHVFHSPYTKQVAKGFSRMTYHDFVRNPSAAEFASVAEQFKGISDDDSYTNKDLERAFIGLGKAEYKNKIEPSLLAAKNIGNMYCASVYFGLASLLATVSAETLHGKRVGMFSYGSGCAATMFSIRVVGSTATIAEKMDLQNRLDARIHVKPEQYSEIMKLREETHQLKEYDPVGDVSVLAPGTFYLTKVDSKFRRSYARVPLAASN